MCLSLLFGLLLGACAARLALRWRFGGPGCHARFRHFDDLQRFSRGISLGEVVQSLELSQRQREEAQPVLAQLRELLGHSPLRLRSALAAVATEPFDRARAEAITAELTADARQRLVDGLEHLHTILIPEQRQVLRDLLRGDRAAAAL
jgi:Spy/CpxP family protein refolding chaperone